MAGRPWPIGAGDIVIFNFGWHRKWASNDPSFSFLESWPGLDRGASEHLLDLGVAAVGTDCLGLDRLDSKDIPAHDTLLKKHVLIIENLANLDGTSRPVLPDRRAPEDLRGVRLPDPSACARSEEQCLDGVRMRVSLIEVPYDSGLVGLRMGAGPSHLLADGMAASLRAHGHEV